MKLLRTIIQSSHRIRSSSISVVNMLTGWIYCVLVVRVSSCVLPVSLDHKHTYISFGTKTRTCILCENDNLFFLQTFPCPHCSKIFSDASNRKKHVNVQHMNIKRFECELCGDRFGYKQQMQSHLLRRHYKHEFHPS